MVHLASRFAGVVSLAMLAAPASAEFDVSVSFDFIANSDNGTLETFNLFPVIDVSGFTDEFNENNVVELLGGSDLSNPDNATFTGLNNSQSSTNFNSFDDLLAEANAQPWSLRIVDGVTGDTRLFDVNVNVDTAFDREYFRFIRNDNFAAGEPFDASEPVRWDLDPAIDPIYEFDSGRAQAFIASTFFDVVDLDPETVDSYAPADGNLPLGELSFSLRFRNETGFDQSILSASAFAADGGAELNSFAAAGSANALLFTSFDVVPAPGAALPLGLAALGVCGRRRKAVTA